VIVSVVFDLVVDRFFVDRFFVDRRDILFRFVIVR